MAIGESGNEEAYFYKGLEPGYIYRSASTELDTARASNAAILGHLQYLFKSFHLSLSSPLSVMASCARLKQQHTPVHSRPLVLPHGITKKPYSCLGPAGTHIVRA